VRAELVTGFMSNGGRGYQLGERSIYPEAPNRTFTISAARSALSVAATELLQILPLCTSGRAERRGPASLLWNAWC